jgi:ABC-type sugar transport system permease subunit
LLQKARERFGYMLVMPALILVLALNLAPMIQGLIMSFQRQNLIRPNPNDFIGINHYIQALFRDPDFWSSTFNTVYWTVGSVTGAYLLSLALALLLNNEIWGRGFFRALFLIPWVVPDVVTALLWKWVYSDQYGIANFLLLKLGLIDSPLLYLSSPDAAMPSVILVRIWQLYPIMTVVLLASLQNVPKEIIEAAKIDGANAFQRFWYVTFNYIRPTSTIIILLAAIWTFQAFDVVYLLTGGGPAGATQNLAIMVYTKAFWSSQLGYAAAIGVLMLLFLVLLGLAQQALDAYMNRGARNG